MEHSKGVRMGEVSERNKKSKLTENTIKRRSQVHSVSQPKNMNSASTLQNNNALKIAIFSFHPESG